MVYLRLRVQGVWGVCFLARGLEERVQKCSYLRNLRGLQEAPSVFWSIRILSSGDSKRSMPLLG